VLDLGGHRDLDDLGEHGVDVNCGGLQARSRLHVWEAFWMSEVRGVEGCLPAFGDDGAAIAKDIGWREDGEPCVMVLLVVPGEEIFEPRARVEVGRKAVWAWCVGTIPSASSATSCSWMIYSVARSIPGGVRETPSSWSLIERRHTSLLSTGSCGANSSSSSSDERNA
jgi:hypothetical protein